MFGATPLEWAINPSQTPTGARASCFWLPLGRGVRRWCVFWALRAGQRSKMPWAEGGAHTPGTRMESRTWRSGIADLKGPPPGAPSGALGGGTPGWFWRCDARCGDLALSPKNMLFCAFFACSQNIRKTPKTAQFSLIPRAFDHARASRAEGHPNAEREFPVLVWYAFKNQPPPKNRADARKTKKKHPKSTETPPKNAKKTQKSQKHPQKAKKLPNFFFALTREQKNCPLPKIYWFCWYAQTTSKAGKSRSAPMGPHGPPTAKGTA